MKGLAPESEIFNCHRTMNRLLRIPTALVTCSCLVYILFQTVGDFTRLHTQNSKTCMPMCKNDRRSQEDYSLRKKTDFPDDRIIDSLTKGVDDCPFITKLNH